MTDCLFCKIIAGAIPSKKVYEDEKTFAFEDIKPGAPTHVLIVPKKHIAGLKEATPEDAESLDTARSSPRSSRVSATSRTDTAPCTTLVPARGSLCSISTCICSADAS